MYNIADSPKSARERTVDIVRKDRTVKSKQARKQEEEGWMSVSNIKNQQYLTP